MRVAVPSQKIKDKKIIKENWLDADGIGLNDQNSQLRTRHWQKRKQKRI